MSEPTGYEKKKARIQAIFDRRNYLYPGPPTVEWMVKELEKTWAALEWYADRKHWTTYWVEGSYGDYGDDRARKALEE